MTLVDQYYGEEAQASQRKDFDTESLERDFKRAQEDKALIEKFIRITREQFERAKATPHKTYVEFRKEHNYSSGHINYRIRVYALPDIPDAQHNARELIIQCPELDGYHKEKGTYNNPFLGNEKKAAVEFAQTIIAKFPGCEVVGNAADLIPKKKEVIKV
ncbi:MAG: hypothetical protein ABR999_10645 [Methanoregula sp.]|jgi:arginine utilization protein RocB|uniref:hypothetical protein n=1 Tax=Methanoregula sp. TaxID=2052170 RepID=UPI003D102023